MKTPIHNCEVSFVYGTWHENATQLRITFPISSFYFSSYPYKIIHTIIMMIIIYLDQWKCLPCTEENREHRHRLINLSHLRRLQATGLSGQLPFTVNLSRQLIAFLFNIFSLISRNRRQLSKAGSTHWSVLKKDKIFWHYCCIPNFLQLL